MHHHPIRIVPKKDDAPAVAPGLLAHLGDLDDYMIADPIPDFRDWNVTLADGRRLGKVDDVIVDTTTMTVKYVEVKLDRDVLVGEDDRWLLIPAELIRVDSDNARVLVDHLPAGGLTNAPQRARGLPSPSEERAILAYYEVTAVGAEHG
ncbi:MAG: hypothetical protein JWM41_1429 [Gemmatimonadetes bacterium]|nr:hypothetical protein [Gemmatimonadota bacterium]